ncbi:MG2 domain-containing protein [uncultured Proteiniphilum sp.]|uniref:alpha-2-macroglobulin family protein n=1 Tax=uncultured Proteiniphilum sp. TaxID=497637 RepID=UPI002631A9B6|nr:MG2 domain-containing protein [uncultured Proteiniphilum sp.]
MKHLSLRFFPALFAVILLLSTGCNTKSTKEIDPEFARYISAFTYGNVSSDAFIQVELVQEIPAVELNAEIKEKLFSFSPSLKGQTFWVNGNTLRFLPDPGELEPGKEYNITFHLGKVLEVEEKFRQFNFSIRVNEQSFTADVLPFSPISTSDLTWNMVEATLNLSNPVSSDDVGKMFDVKGVPHKHIRVMPAGITSFRVVIDSLQRTDKREQYLLTIDGKAINSKKKLEYTIDIPAFSKEYFEVTDVRVIQASDPHIRLTFSDPVSQTQDLEGLIVPSGVNNFTYRIDKNVIKIYPETFPKEKIDLQIHQGIQNNSGLSLDKTYLYQLQIEDDKPQIKFEKSGNILPDAEQLLLPFSAVNLWAVDAKVIKVYRNNLLYYLQSSSLNNNQSGGELRRFGRLVMKKRIRLDRDKQLDLSKWNNFTIDLSQMIEKDPGALYMVQLSMRSDYSLYACDGMRPQVPNDVNMNRFSDSEISEEDEAVWDETSPYYYEPIDWSGYKWEERDDPCKPTYYMSYERMAQTMVMASNVGIIAKAGQDHTMSVAVTDILTTQPMSGADVTVYNYQMQVLGSAKTDGNGFAEIDYKKGRPFVVTAAKSGDIGYLEVKEEASLSLSRFDVSGKEIQKGLKGYVYAERGVWRPGDTIFVSFILEDKERKLPEGHPVTLEVYTPRGQFYQRQVKSDGVNGFYTFSVTTDPAAETGMWQGLVKVGGTTFHKSLRIETIKPNRLRVRLDTDSIIDAANGVISGTLTSQWLHGAPASNLKAEVDLTLYASDNPFKGYTGYSFNNPVVNFETSKTKIFEGVLNASGVASVNAKVPVAENAPGMLRGNILSRVYEAGGDMSFYAQTVFYSPYKTYVGVKSPAVRAGEFLETDRPVSFDVVTVNAYGKPVSGSVEYSVYKLNWSWWWNSTGEDLGAYVNNTAANVVANGEVTLTNGKGKIDFQVDYPDWGRYLLLLKDKSGKHATGTVFYVDWPSWRGRSAKTDPEGLTMLSFSTDKPSYEAGEKATVIIPKSSQGRVLISIENGSGILHREWVKTSEEEDTKYVIEVTEKMAPNFYIFATMLQPHAQTVNDLPIRMYGVVNVGVENKNSILEPVIRMPDTLHPEKEFTVSVSEKSKKPMTYTLAIVDEGLLDLTAFKTPNAWSEFYAREALGVRTWDLFDRVLGANSGLMGPLLSIGGDEALNPSRDNVNRFKPIVKFLGPFALKSGETKAHTIRLPQYIGSVRVMVVAGGNGAYGSADKTVAVKNDLMTLSTLPRVMGPGEEVWLPVNVFAMGNNVKNVQVSIRTKGLLTPTDGTAKSVSFDKPGDKIVFFKLASGKEIGAEQVEIKASGNGISFTETIDIAVRNPNPPIVLTQAQLIEPGGSATLNIQTDGVEPGDWATLELSRLPSVNFSRNMNYLLEYPHGCSEQITSQAFPLLYIEEFTVLKEDEKKRMTAKVDEVIRILSSRQLADGGFMFWYGDNYASEWVSSYAGHFLIEAKNRGYEVPETVLSRWTQFQRRLAQNWLPTNPTHSYYAVSMTDLQQAYRLYTLALSGNTELGAMNRMRELTGLSLQARWRLAAAYALAGRKDVANSLVFNASDVVEEYDFNNDTYGTSGRDQAMILETYLLLDNVEKAMLLAPSVAQSLSSGYISTQTAAFGLVAMAQLAAKIGTGNIDIDWTLNGGKMEGVNTPKAIYQVDINPAMNLSVSLTNKGSGKLYARLSARTRPQIDSNYEPAQGRFKLSVRYVDLNGSPLNVESLPQGAEFTAVVTVQNGVEQAFTDLALTQVFPSGWEIFNERMLGGDAAAPDAGYTYRDIRDDRVLTYFNLGAGQTKTFRVRLQAAYRGNYYLPPVSCQAMYAPQEEARNKGMWIKVAE